MSDLHSGRTLIDPPELQIKNYIILALVAVTLIGAGSRRGAAAFRNSRPRYLPALCIVFYLYVLVTAAWAPAGAPAFNKGIDIGTLGAATLCVSYWTQGNCNKTFQRSFWRTFCITGGVFIVLTLLGYGLTDANRTAALGGGPNVFGRNMGMAFFGSLWLMQQEHGFWWLAVVIVSPLMVVMSGSRGALVAFVFAVLVYIGTEQTVWWKRLALMATTVAGCVAMLLLSAAGERTIAIFQQRVLQLTVNERYSAGRTDMAQAAYQIGMEYPVTGAGLAAFPVYTGEPYAHNIFLETFSETGVIGVLMLALPITVFASFVLKRWKLTSRASVCALITAFTSAQFSGGLFDSRCVFLFMLMSSSLLVPTRKIYIPAAAPMRSRAIHRMQPTGF